MAHTTTNAQAWPQVSHPDTPPNPTTSEVYVKFHVTIIGSCFMKPTQWLAVPREAWGWSGAVGGGPSDSRAAPQTGPALAANLCLLELACSPSLSLPHNPCFLRLSFFFSSPPFLSPSLILPSGPKCSGYKWMWQLMRSFLILRRLPRGDWEKYCYVTHTHTHAGIHACMASSFPNCSWPAT